MSDNGVGLYPVEIVDVDLLVLDPNNARLHPERNLQEIEKSFREFGQDQALVVQRDTNVIIKGNGRYLVARDRLEWSKIEVRYVDDDEAQAIRRSLLDNRSADTAEWDPGMLIELGRKVDLTDAGWDKFELDQMNISWEPPDDWMPGGAENDEYEDGDEDSEYVGGDNGSNFESGPVEPREGKNRDERSYHFAFTVSFDESILVDRAIKEADAKGKTPGEWLFQMAQFDLQGLPALLEAHKAENASQDG